MHQYVTFASTSPLQQALAEYMTAHPEHHLELPAFYQERRDYFAGLLADTKFRALPAARHVLPARGLQRDLDVARRGIRALAHDRARRGDDSGVRVLRASRPTRGSFGSVSPRKTRRSTRPPSACGGCDDTASSAGQRARGVGPRPAASADVAVRYSQYASSASTASPIHSPAADCADAIAGRQREHVGAAGDDDRNRDHDAHQRFARDHTGREQHAFAPHAFGLLGRRDATVRLERALAEPSEQAAEEDRHA